MKGEQLAKLATAAYGAQWKVALGAAAEISREQLWRYEKNVTPISDGLAVSLSKILKREFEKQRRNLDKEIEARRALLDRSIKLVS